MYMYVRSCKSLREAEVEWGEIDETKLKKLKWDRTTDHAWGIIKEFAE